MTSLHKEIYFESDIVAHLTKYEWIEGAHEKYDRELALYPEDVIGWIEDTQPKAWERFIAANIGSPEKTLLKRLASVLDKDGSLSVLRQGFKNISIRFDMCQFKPAHSINPEIQDRYGKVRCRVVRQVRYCLYNDKSIDLVFFINGIPVATAELKTDFTQSIEDAINQYRNDRNPKDPTSKREEPLLAFKRRALVHFAVSTDEVWMTTDLKGKHTNFLPFNLGNNGGAGNPANPNGYRTAYWYEEILQRDVFLNIIARYVHLVKKEVVDELGKKTINEHLIFPRYHQWKCVTKIIATAKQEKAGYKYLIQHSAGSGKTNSIAWLAHQLANLHDDFDQKIFSSVIVITDRTILDRQPQAAIYEIEHKQGVVCKITNASGSKSSELAQALKEGVPIIIVTIQTFPFVLDAIRKITNLKSRTFAIIADEAHSSQSGATAKKLKQVLTAKQIEEGVEVGVEDLLAAEIAARPQSNTLSYFAFTATPKSKTLELFGRLQNPLLPKSDDNKPEPFHLYSMRQAIEEGFILDVLRNYTPYKLAYKLAHNGKDYDSELVDKSEAMKSLMNWVRLHPYNISQKVQVIVEHFVRNVLWRLDGQAKAMVVTGSRKEAVRYKIAIDKYIKSQGHKDIATLVAFSGEVFDSESGYGSFSENNMNTGLNGRDVPTAFDSRDYQILLVANKYQTGFDQPKLMAMYVDKKLSGVAAVQTLSRLNRIYPNKDQTFIIDFVNSAEDIRSAFQPYYETTELAGVSDPNIIHDLQTKLDDCRIYTSEEVNNFVTAYFKGKQSDMQEKIAPTVDRYRTRLKEAVTADDNNTIESLEIFRKDIGTFLRTYDFLSQIVVYDDTDLERRAIFFKHLLPWLKSNERADSIDLSEVKMTHYKLSNMGKRDIALTRPKEEDKLKPLTDVGSGKSRDPLQLMLSEIIEKMNDLFDGDLDENDRLAFLNHVTEKMFDNEKLAQQAAANTQKQFGESPDYKNIMMESVVEGLDKYQSMAKQVLNSSGIQDSLAALLVEMVYAKFKRRATTQTSIQRQGDSR